MTQTCQHRHDDRKCRLAAVYVSDGIAGCAQCDRYYRANTPDAGERTFTEYGAALARSYAAEVAYVEAHGAWRSENAQWS